MIKTLKKHIKIMIFTLLIFNIIFACDNKNKYSTFLDNQYIELYYQFEMQQHGSMADYANHDKLNEEESKIIYDYPSIIEINFDNDGKLWSYSTRDGYDKITIYDKKGKKNEYVHIFTTSGGEDSADWYHKFVDEKEEGTSKEEVEKIFDMYETMDVDFKRGLNLRLNNKKYLPEYLRLDEDENQQTVFYGKYDTGLIGRFITQIEWTVLYKDKSKALLLSNIILERKKIDSENNHKDWNDCELKHFLNEEFYNKLFSSKEKKAIVPNDYEEKISLLSQEDIDKYFKENKNYLKAECSGKVIFEVYSEANESKKTYIKDCSYWLKSKNQFGDYSYIDNNGEIKYVSVNEEKGIRPIIWVAIE